MLIVAGWLNVVPEDRNKYVEMHKDVVLRGRAAPGCLDLAISEDPLDAGRVNIFEYWESEAQLAEWRARADPPASFTRILGGDVQKHQISASGPPFD